MCEGLEELKRKFEGLRGKVELLDMEVQKLWESRAEERTRFKLLQEARERTQRKIESPPEGASDDWKALNEGITNLVFRSSWPEDDWV